MTTRNSAQKRTHLVCLLLGSNIQPEIHLPLAVSHLSRVTVVVAVSQVWESPAVGTEGPDYLNAAVLIRTHLPPSGLKRQVIQPVEAELGRVRQSDKFAPRTIDIDIAVWSGRLVRADLCQHAYAALPISELLPELTIGDSCQPLAAFAETLRLSSQIWLRRDILLPLP